MFNQYKDKVLQINGFLNPDEAEWLYNAARQICIGQIVEIGSWEGKSTCCLGLGLQDNKYNPETKVWAVDIHTGSPECHLMFKSKDLWTFPNFWQNIKQFGITEQVIPIIGSSKVVNWAFALESINLLFIDGAHDYHSVFADLNNWVSRVMVGGVIAMHDVYNSKPIERAMNDYIQVNNNLSYISRVNTIAVLKRINK